jgi:Holliday junction resolvase RusA-like endonuclease
MSSPLLFVLPLEAVPKARPRKGKGGKFYTPKKTAFFEEALAWLVRSQLARPLEGPLRLTVLFGLRRPKRAPASPQWHTNTPDLDNLVKALFDGLNGVAWSDDSQICQLVTSKHYVARGSQPSILLTIERL